MKNKNNLNRFFGVLSVDSKKNNITFIIYYILFYLEESGTLKSSFSMNSEK
jgi:hypothetical protein